MWHSSLDSDWILVAVWDDADPEEGVRRKEGSESAQWCVTGQSNAHIRWKGSKTMMTLFPALRFEFTPPRSSRRAKNAEAGGHRLRVAKLLLHDRQAFAKVTNDSMARMTGTLGGQSA